MIASRRFMRCATCRVVFRTDGADRLAEYHAETCDGTLSLDDGCHAVIFHGPGHQSTSRCRLTGEHERHETIYGSSQTLARWTGDEGITGFFDEPEDDD